MNYFIFIYVLMVGLIIGSFLNVCIYRIPHEESLAFPPSHCPKCNNRLKAIDLVPVFSYLFLKGKCRYCGDKISVRYPLIELLVGVMFSLLFLKYGISIAFFKYAVMVVFLVVIAMIDWDTTDIYFTTTFPGSLIAIAFIVYNFFVQAPVLTYVYGALVGGGFIALLVVLTRGMGAGDIEIFILCGLFLGLELTILTLMLSFVIGGVIGSYLIISKKKSRKDFIPFGPFIAIAAAVSILIGDKILSLVF